MVQSRYYTVFTHDQQPCIAHFPSRLEVTDIGKGREDEGWFVISNAVANSTAYGIRLEWLIEYVPRPDTAWYVQLGRPLVPPDAMTVIQDILSKDKTFMIDVRANIIQKSHKVATLAGVGRHVITSSGATMSMMASQHH